MKTIIKAWNDVMTVPKELKKMKAEYEQEGYSAEELPGTPGFKLILDDGEVWFYWENDKIVQEIIEKKRPSLDERFDDYQKNTKQEEFDW